MPGKLVTGKMENGNEKGKCKRKIRETIREIRGNKQQVTRVGENGMAGENQYRGK